MCRGFDAPPVVCYLMASEQSNEEQTESVERTATRDDGGWSRRTVLAATGAISFGTLTRLVEARAASAPDEFDAYRNAVAEAVESTEPVIDQGPYEPTWESLGDVDPIPEWYRDAKFGIFFHWGPYAVPAFGHEWYPRQMYNEGNWINEHHRETYGDPADAPYQDFVPEFTAEHFDAEEWAELFEQSGAKYAGPVTEHHDGWSLWDSEITPWNAGDTGPERDLAGELESAIHDKGLRFVTTFHHSYNLLGDDGYFSTAYENYPSVTEGYPDQVMYGNLPETLQLDTWLAKLSEVIQGYSPDFVWFDWGLPDIPDEYKQRFLAYYYNKASVEDRDVVVTNKRDALPTDVSVEDYELGRPRSIQDRAWNAEFKVADDGGWGYVEDRTFHSVERLVHTLIDAVSKNGQLLLSIGPRADGTIEDAERERLLAIGDWLDTHGDAIYGTRPWEAFGEGPTRLEEGGEFTGQIEYTPEDVRYTRSKDGQSVYTIVMGWPETETLVLEGMTVENPSDAPPRPPGHGGSPPGQGDPPTDTGPTEVTLMGHGSVDYGVDENGRLHIDVPDLSESERPGDVAVAFELEKFELTPTESAHR